MATFALEMQMRYPVLSEDQLASRWRISVKTLRRWRASDEGPRWHKLFKRVRYHEADVLEFEMRGAQFWEGILGEGECAPNALTQSDGPHEEHADGTTLLAAVDVSDVTALPTHWFADPASRAQKEIPHLILVGNVRFSLATIWRWEQANSIVGKPAEPRAIPVKIEVATAPSRVPRWYELARAQG